MAHGIPETHPEERGMLNISPKVNNVERKGGLPPYVNAIAVALVRSGMDRSRAIATARNSVEKTCATGHWGGNPKMPISPAIRDEACKAVADMKARNLSEPERPAIRLTHLGRAVARASHFQRIYTKLKAKGLSDKQATALARAAAKRMPAARQQQ